MTNCVGAFEDRDEDKDEDEDEDEDEDKVRGEGLEGLGLLALSPNNLVSLRSLSESSLASDSKSTLLTSAEIVRVE